MMLRVLLTNDDGIEAEGLRALTAQLAPKCDVLVVAPERQSSAKSHSITLHKPLRLGKVESYPGAATGVGPVDAHSCSGTPADCAMLGLLHLFKDAPPDVVLSGINSGENVAQDLTYSGTVGGALEGAINGIPSLAISRAGGTHLSYADAARLVDILLNVLLYNRLPYTGVSLARGWDGSEAERDEVMFIELPRRVAEPGEEQIYTEPEAWLPGELNHTLCLNVNIPDRPLSEIKGLCWARPGHRDYVDVVQIARDPKGREYFWIGGERVEYEDEHPGTDTHALLKGYIPLTPISYDIAARPDFEMLKAWIAGR